MEGIYEYILNLPILVQVRSGFFNAPVSAILSEDFKDSIQGINSKGCLYFIGKGNLEFSFQNEGLPQKLPVMSVLKFLLKVHIIMFII